MLIRFRFRSVSLLLPLGCVNQSTMDIVEKLEHYIRYDQSVEEQLANLALFDNITDAEIEGLFSEHKSSEVGILLQYLGPVRLQKFLPQFLQFLQDMNWPGSRGTDNMLVAAGEMLVPEIRRVFREENDSLWNYWIVLAVLQRWDATLVASLQPALLHLIQHPDSEGTATAALAVLDKNHLLTQDELLNLYQQLRADYQAMHYNWGDNWWPDYQHSLLTDLDEVLAEAS